VNDSVEEPAKHRPWWQRALISAGRLTVIGLLLGWLYAWAGPRVYPVETRFGFFWGMAHGALMPMALPALLLGKDVSIFSEYNTGRTYKLGYICGINVCGLLFFGGAFWRPSQRPSRSTVQ
jgi:hypothetical protein